MFIQLTFQTCFYSVLCKRERERERERERTHIINKFELALYISCSILCYFVIKANLSPLPPSLPPSLPPLLSLSLTSRRIIYPTSSKPHCQCGTRGQLDLPYHNWPLVLDSKCRRPSGVYQHNRSKVSILLMPRVNVHLHVAYVNVIDKLITTRKNGFEQSSRSLNKTTIQ